LPPPAPPPRGDQSRRFPQSARPTGPPSAAGALVRLPALLLIFKCLNRIRNGLNSNACGFDFSTRLHYLEDVILILTGAVHSGKTSLLRKLSAELIQRGIGVDGFLSLAAFENKEHIGYDLFDLKAETVVPFIRRQGAPGWPAVGPYSIRPDILAEARRKIVSHRTEDLLIVDEVGPLEIRGEGLWPALSAVLSRSSLRCLLVARRGILEDLKGLIGGSSVRIFDIGDRSVESELFAEILQSTNSMALPEGPRHHSRKETPKKRPLGQET
jgi:nucleoside-triphosphatase